MALKLQHKEGLFPPGGWQFKDSDQVLHVAPDLARLIKVLANYRKNAGRPAGDPEQEILTQICARTPALCHSNVPAFDGKALAIFVAADIHAAFMEVGQTGKLATVNPPEANQRALACAGCEFRVNWAKGCSPCHKKAQPIAATVVHPQRAIPGTEEYACLLARESLLVSTWRVNVKPLLGAPDHCWRKAP